RPVAVTLGVRGEVDRVGTAPVGEGLVGHAPDEDIRIVEVGQRDRALDAHRPSPPQSVGDAVRRHLRIYSRIRSHAPSGPVLPESERPTSLRAGSTSEGAHPVSRTLLIPTVLSDEQAGRRDLVVAAATELAETGGYDAVVMKEVADRSGVALATIYRWFAS